MKQNTKDWLQYSSALVFLASAIFLAMWSFYMLSEVHGSVLAYVGEAIAFVAGVFGLALYARNEIKKEFRQWVRDDEGRLQRSDADEADEENKHD